MSKQIYSKEEFDKLLHTAEGVLLAREALKNGLQIEWDLSGRTELIPIDEHTPNRCELFASKEGEDLTPDEETAARLVYLSSKGKKITPPVFDRQWVIADGIPKAKKRKPHAYRCTSIRLGRLLGYEYMPMSVCDTLSGYSFTPSLWDFEFKKTELIATQKEGGRTISVKVDSGTGFALSNTGELWVDQVRIVKSFDTKSESSDYTYIGGNGNINETHPNTWTVYAFKGNSMVGAATINRNQVSEIQWVLENEDVITAGFNQIAQQGQKGGFV